MNRPHFLVLLPLSLCLLALMVVAGERASAEKLPNIVMIFTDDQGVDDVGCYGSEIQTPHIDDLAKQGMRFTQFYAASSICTPSRYGLLTGQFSHRSRDGLLSALMFLAEVDSHRGLRTGERTYVSDLDDAGYQTALVGKWHLGHGEEQFWPTEHGFHSFFGHTAGCVDFFKLSYGNRPDWYRGRELVETDGYATDVITDEAISVLKANARSDRPLYLHISYNAPHFGKGWDDDKQSTVNIMQPKPADLQKVAAIKNPLRRAFAAKVVGMDESIGELMKTLDELSIADNTLVIFMTDHGGDPKYGGSNKPLRGEKATLYEGGIRVPCIVRWPGYVAPGSVSEAVTCAIDWSATFGEMIGYTPRTTDGVSMLPILQGKKQKSPRTLIWKTGKHDELDRGSWNAVRKADWKWVRAPGKPAELFDLAKDPNETNDVITKHPSIAKELASIASQP